MVKRKHRPSVVSFDLLSLMEPVDAVLAQVQRGDPGATRANVIRQLLTEALKSRKEIK